MKHSTSFPWLISVPSESLCALTFTISPQRRYLFHSLHSRCSWILWFSRSITTFFVSFRIFLPDTHLTRWILLLQPRAFLISFSYPSFVRVLCVSKYILLPEYTLNVPLLAYINSLIMYRHWPTLFYFPIISQLFVTTTFLPILEYLYWRPFSSRLTPTSSQSFLSLHILFSLVYLWSSLGSFTRI